ncbi:PFE-CTERM domain-containing protein [Thalassoporum mexicanum]|nr:hypothetical protein [Pseudanabaena sp. PCC 7367]
MVLFLATASLCGAIGLPNPAAALTFSMMDNLEAPGGGFFGDPIGPGFTIERNQYESDTNVFFFLESVNQIFAVPIAVDADQPGVNYNSGNLSIGAIPAGIMIDSYYFSYDPETDGIGISRSTTASITFDKPIGGLIFQDTFLSASDTLDPSNLNFAQANVTYPPDGIVNPGINDMNIGVDGGSAGITWTGRTLNFDVSAGSNGVDNVRVLLVPFEFSPSMGLVALGLGAAGWYVAKKRVARLRKIS